jgi:hypothetical protein
MQLLSLSTVLGVELKLIGSNQYDCRFCLITKKNNAITIEKKCAIKGPLTEVLEKLPKNIPLALNLTGKGLLFKNVTLEQPLTDSQNFQAAFPAIDQKDFYTQCYHDQAHSLINIIRAEVVDDLLSKFKLSGLNVYILSLGAIVSKHVWPFLNSYHSPIQFDEHKFELTDMKQFSLYSLLKITPEINAPNFQLKIGEEPIEADCIIAYAAAMQLILHEKVDLINADIPTIEADFNKFLTERKLKKTALFFLAGLFALLLISFLTLTYYNSVNTKLIRLVGTQTANADQTDLMKKNTAESEALLKQLNWNGGYNYGLLLDEIGSTLPKQLKLAEIVMNDFKTAQEKIERKPNIRIIGTTDNLTAVNNWMFVLKEKPWVKTVKLLKYQDDLETTLYQFNLIITY